MNTVAQGTEQAGKTRSSKQEEVPANGDVYVYKDSGIRERHGTIPDWLQRVAYGLFIWGIFYLIRYWGAGQMEGS